MSGGVESANQHANRLLRIWRAGRVRRWHTDPFLSSSPDYLDGHGARVAKLMLGIWFDADREMLIQALTHDDGEPGAGDMSHPVKLAYPAMAKQLKAIEQSYREALWPDLLDPSFEDSFTYPFLVLCDRLDAWLWVAHHAPKMLEERRWQEERRSLLLLAQSLKVYELVENLLCISL